MFRHHLIWSKPSRLVTDHQPLLYCISLEGLTGQCAHFVLIMQEFNFVIKHLPGVKHQNVDTLSQHPHSSTIDNSGARPDEEEATPTMGVPTDQAALGHEHRHETEFPEPAPTAEAALRGAAVWAGAKVQRESTYHSGARMADAPITAEDVLQDAAV